MNNIVAEKQWIQSRLNIPYENLSQSYLRAETALSSSSTIPFYLQRGQVASPLVTEVLLNLNDQFVITHLSIGLKTIASDSPTALQQLSALVHPWEDPQVFTGTNRPNVAAIYGGQFSMTIDRKQYLPNFSMRSFRRVGTTQTNAFLDTAGLPATPAQTFTGNFGVNEWTNGLYSFYPMEPTLLDGRQTIDIQIDLGTAVGFDDTNVTTYAVLEARGYLVVNSKS